MVPNNLPAQDATFSRRERVAHYRRLRLSTRQIAERIAAEGVVNEHGEPFSHVTIADDLKSLRADWTEAAQVDIAIMLGEELDQLDEAMQAAVLAVRQGIKRVVDYEEILDPKSGRPVKRVPIFEDAQDLQAVATLVKVAESRRKLLALDKVFKMPTEEKDDIASRTADRIAEAFRMAAPTAAPSDDPPADAAADTAA